MSIQLVTTTIESLKESNYAIPNDCLYIVEVFGNQSEIYIIYLRASERLRRLSNLLVKYNRRVLTKKLGIQVPH